MTREEAKELLPIMQAFAEGKTIEYRESGGAWKVAHTPTWSSCLFYRIKPEPKYRPFRSREECWNEMQKHQPFGWVKEISSETLYLINGIFNTGIGIMEDSSFKEALNIYEFKDGTPFGIRED